MKANIFQSTLFMAVLFASMSANSQTINLSASGINNASLLTQGTYTGYFDLSSLGNYTINSASYAFSFVDNTNDDYITGPKTTLNTEVVNPRYIAVSEYACSYDFYGYYSCYDVNVHNKSVADKVITTSEINSLEQGESVEVSLGNVNQNAGTGTTDILLRSSNQSSSIYSIPFTSGSTRIYSDPSNSGYTSTYYYDYLNTNTYSQTGDFSITGNITGPNLFNQLSSLNQFSFSFIVNGSLYLTSATLSLDVSEVAAVPEPETYALILAGLGLVGYSARRRQVK